MNLLDILVIAAIVLLTAPIILVSIFSVMDRYFNTKLRFMVSVMQIQAGLKTPDDIMNEHRKEEGK